MFLSPVRALEHLESLSGLLPFENLPFLVESELRINRDPCDQHYAPAAVATGPGTSSIVSAGGFSAPAPGSGAITCNARGSKLIFALPFPRRMPSAAISKSGDVF